MDKDKQAEQLFKVLIAAGMKQQESKDRENPRKRKMCSCGEHEMCR